MGKKTFTLRDGEQLFADKVGGDCWKMPNVIGSKQITGKYYFTDQRIVFLATGLVGTDKVSWEIEMKDIEAVKTCTTPPCFPFGIFVTMKNGDQYKLSILKRAKYFEWITQHVA